MNDIIKIFVKSLSNSTLTLRKKGILIEKPWALLDTDGNIQKLIFKNDKGLILSKNGKVTEGAWDYFPEAKSLLIDRGYDKLLLNEMFIDENVLILKKDGSGNEFFTLANENTLPDLDVPKYLNKLECKRLNIQEVKLLNGNSMQLRNYDGYHISNCSLRMRNEHYKNIEVHDGKYLTADLTSTFNIEDGKIFARMINTKIRLDDGQILVIENVNKVGQGIGDVKSFINENVTINGKTISDQRLKSGENVFEIANNTIQNIYFEIRHELSNGKELTLEQKYLNKVKKGDKVLNYSTGFSIPDGKYKIKGKLFGFKVKNETVI